ncbi:hypothetical protein O7631_17535 [Micromonospora sp. WMMD967]|uniref:hypothetical protein n=1 Tax=Micromonospora sp. WMMD967 TaxID=3016101 RepID=UPI0024171CB0|nr:hypothetical protein [Micromonospora sp. WMMD967]MDG4838324.1 hypothetical protein [Micromonospora sp. WMMD967]
MTAARPTPVRVFAPLAKSPLLNRLDAEHTDLAVLLATTADPEPATVRALLSITAMPVADRVARALDDRADLPLTSLALLAAHRPDAKRATGTLRGRLFPDAAAPGTCHTFARTVAALAYQPASVDDAYLSGERFRESAAAADPAVLGELLVPLLDADTLSDPAETGLIALLDARASHAPTAQVDLAATAALTRARRHRVRAGLIARREQTVRDLAHHTAGLTLAAELWFDAMTTAADTPAQASQALAMTEDAADTLASGGDLPCAWPAVRSHWQQVTAARTTRTHQSGWEEAWQAAEATDDGARWDDTQRALVTGYDLLAEHVRTTWPRADVPPTPDECWAADPTGRMLLHIVADHLTGHQTHSPLPHYDDRLLIAFVHGLAKNRRDSIPADLHVTGLIAAIKAARSKAALLARAVPADLGIVVPMRAETQRLTRVLNGDNALAAKVAQLGWLLAAHPDARADLLLVDESTDCASARAAAEAIQADHPQIRVTITARPDDGSAKGGAVLWGLAELAGAGRTILAYTDLDLTYPLDQLGLHIAALDQPTVGAVVGSRRRPDSHGYYPPAGPVPTALLYQRAVRDLLQLDTTDPQAGFKAFPVAALRAALPLVTDQSLAFDSDLLAAIRRSNYTVAEVGIAALHQYVEGPRGTPRDYDAMLNAVHRQALHHGLDPDLRRTPTWDRIRHAGSLAAAAAERPPTTLLMPSTPR